MAGKNPRSTTYAELAILAGSVGVTANTEAGRQVFVDWLKVDQTAARAALFSRVAARRVAASAAKAAAAPVEQYPAGWLAAAGVQRRPSPSGVTSAPAPAHRPINAAEHSALLTGESTRYPASWDKTSRSQGAAPAVDARGRRASGPRITEGND
jgi:hypothetical protein